MKLKEISTMKDMKKTFSTIRLVALGMGFALSSAQAAGPVNLIVNGDFETGSFAGWSVVPGAFGATYAINNGTFVPFFGGPLAPIDGNFDVVGTQFGPSLTSLQQTITVPNNIFSAKLAWSDRVRNFASLFLHPGQEWRVVIRDTGGALLLVDFTTNPGDPLLQVGPNSRSADMTGFLQAHADQTIVVSFETQAEFFFITTALDDVKLLVSILPQDKDECKDSGWATFVNVNTGVQIFKNQGDCVSFVATKGKNPPDHF
jgi:hypothetical protein